MADGAWTPQQGTPVPPVMDMRQAAAYLGLSADTLYRYAAEGFMPAFKCGNRWRFRKQRLDRWMDAQMDARKRKAMKKARRRV